MIKAFSCKNFKNVTVEEMKFSKINILLGPNNSGKTNFIRALSFCADMVNNAERLIGDSAFLTLACRYGISDVYNKFSEDTSGTVEMNWKLDLENQKKVDYRLEFHTGDHLQDFFITQEKLDDRETPLNKKEPFNYFNWKKSEQKAYISKAVKKGEFNNRIEFRVPNNDTILRQFNQIRLENKQIYDNSSRQVGMIQALQDHFRKYYFYSSSQFDLKKIREPQPIHMNGITLEKDGSNFVNVFNHYKSNNIYMPVDFLDRLRDLIPDVDSADVVAEFNKLVFKIGLEGQQFNLNELSDGTIKALLLTLLIHVPINEGFSMLALDEPELNIHPAWQQIIGRWIQYSGNFKQCFISTHSPELLDTFTEGFRRGDVSVFVFDPREEKAVRVLEYERLKEELEDWELGDLYRVNDPSVGGWPW